MAAQGYIGVSGYETVFNMTGSCCANRRSAPVYTFILKHVFIHSTFWLDSQFSPWKDVMHMGVN